MYNVFHNGDPLCADTLSRDEHEANARLIAAAPDLYDALKLYMAIDSARHAGVRISAATWADAWQASTAAIAKAREAIP